MSKSLEERVLDIVNSSQSTVRKQEKMCFAYAEDVLASKGLRVDDTSRERLARAIAAAIQRASLVLAKAAAGDFTEIPAPRSPLHSAQVVDFTASITHTRPSTVSAGVSVSLSSLFNDWYREAQATGIKPSTLESYNATVTSFRAFLKHDDATRVTRDDVVSYKDFRLNKPSRRTGKPVSAKTVRDSDLVALKTLFGWGVINGKIAFNPAERLTVKIGARVRLRSPDFTEVEALAILSAAWDYRSGKGEADRTAFAKRWIPWLCALTGARVGEIAQLRRQDVWQEGEDWVIRITLEAGTVKTNEARDVPLHMTF